MSKAKVAALESVFEEARSLVHRLREVSEELHREDGLAGGLRELLAHLAAHGPEPVPRIARRRGVSRQHVQAQVNRLRAAGLVQPRANPAHRRSSVIGLTPAGREMLAEAAARDGILHAEVSATLSKRDLREAAATLRRVRDSLAERAPGRPRTPAPVS